LASKNKQGLKLDSVERYTVPKTLYKKTVQENMDDDSLTNRIFPGPTH
jgi:hypothetical protein